MAFGSWPVVTLAAARELHIDARRVLAKGIDPMAQRKAEKTSAKIVDGETFDVVCKAWYEHWKGDKNADHAESVWRRIEGDILPVIGHLPSRRWTRRPSCPSLRGSRRGVLPNSHGEQSAMWAGVSLCQRARHHHA